MEQVTVMPICSSQFLGGKTSGTLPYPKPSPDPEHPSGRTATQGNLIVNTISVTKFNY